MFKKIKSYLDYRKVYKRTVNELYSLSDRELADIGISRADIEYIARQSLEDNIERRYR